MQGSAIGQRIIREIDPVTGIVVLETYRVLRGDEDHCVLHRDPGEGPAYTRRDDETGTIVEERYYWRGRKHREDGPAVLAYNRTGVVILEAYYRHGLAHRDPKEGPAFIDRDLSGTVRLRELYWVKGELLRNPADAPWHIQRDYRGNIVREDYSGPDEMPPSRTPSRPRSSGRSRTRKPSP